MSRACLFCLYLPLTVTLLVGSATAAEVPQVVLSDEHKAMCKLGVGDVMPVPVNNGGSVAAKPTAGKSITVFAFVKGKGWMTKQLLKDLGPDVTKRFGGKGVEAVAVFVDEQPPKNAAYTVLNDPGGRGFALVGSGATPRVYVVDAAGKIVWFDIEYSRSTRRELRQTLEVLTAGK